MKDGLPKELTDQLKDTFVGSIYANQVDALRARIAQLEAEKSAIREATIHEVLSIMSGYYYVYKAEEQIKMLLKPEVNAGECQHKRLRYAKSASDGLPNQCLDCGKEL